MKESVFLIQGPQCLNDNMTENHCDRSSIIRISGRRELQ